MGIILAWGAVIFEPTKQGFESLQHRYDFGWSKQELMNKSPLYQAAKKETHDISITGTLYTEKVGHDQMLNIFKKQGQSQKPYFMADGTGRVYGKFILLTMDGVEQEHLSDGIPLKQEYNLSFAHVSKANSLFSLF